MNIVVDKSTMSWKEYLCELAWATAVALLGFRNLLFRCLPGQTFEHSWYLLLGLVIGSIIFEGFFLFRCKRSWWGILICLALPLGVYTVVAYIVIASPIIVGSLSCAIAASLIYTVYWLKRNPEDKEKRTWHRFYKRRLYSCFQFSQFSFAAAFLVIMIFLGGQGILGQTLLSASRKAEITDPASERALDMDTLLLLQEDQWEDLTVKERLNVMQYVANREAGYLGVPHELQVGTANLEEQTKGAYVDSFHMIYISLELLQYGTAHQALEVVLHEAAHAFQYRLADAYLQVDDNTKNLMPFRKAALYAEELHSYKDGDEDFDVYYNQTCEEDSREYAEKGVEMYYHLIETYLEDREPPN